MNLPALKFMVCRPAMLIELGLKRFLVLVPVRAMAVSLRTERNGGTSRTLRFHRNIGQPFRNANSRFFHRGFAFLLATDLFSFGTACRLLHE